MCHAALLSTCKQHPHSLDEALLLPIMPAQAVPCHAKCPQLGRCEHLQTQQPPASCSGDAASNSALRHMRMVQFETDLGTLRRQHSPLYSQRQFWWTAIPILLTVGLATAAITLRITSPSAVRMSALLPVSHSVAEQKMTSRFQEMHVMPYAFRLGALSQLSSSEDCLYG